MNPSPFDTFRAEIALGALSATAALFLCTAPLAAQSCWRGHQLPRCRSFWITESGPRFGNNEAFGDGTIGSATALGLMKNRSQRTALGGSLELSTGGESGTYRLTVMPRYRRWLGASTALDLGVGVAVIGEGERAGGFKGVSALAAFNYADWMAVTAVFETRHGTSLGTQTAGSVGIRFGSYAGPVVALASLVLGIAAGGAGS